MNDVEGDCHALDGKRRCYENKVERQGSILLRDVSGPQESLEVSHVFLGEEGLRISELVLRELKL